MANAKKVSACVNMTTDGNGKIINGQVTKDIGGPTLDDVTAYIKSMFIKAKELAKATLNVTEMHLHLQELFANASADTYDLNEVTQEHFENTGEKNPSAYIASMYMLNNLSDDVDEMAKFAAVHDGWAICRLMNVDNSGKFSFNYVTNRIYKERTKDYKDGITIIEYYLNDKTKETEPNYQNKNIPSLEYLVKLGQNYTSDGTLIIKHLQNNVFVKIHLEEGKSTIIRADQLCMFVPFERLGTKFTKGVDDAFLKEYVKKGIESKFKQLQLSDGDKENFKYQIISNLLIFKKAEEGGRGRRGGSASSHTPSPQRVMIGGKQRVVYKGKRGGEYIKKGGEFITLNKALKAISIK